MSLYRKATDSEIRFYQSELYPLQDRVFAIASQYERQIYLTGGTALSRFYYRHRLSEDLDFFTTTNDLKLIANDLASQLQASGLAIEIERIESYFAQFFVLGEDYRLKVDFVREFNHIGNLEQTDKGIYLNNLEDMGANKISAFEDRAEIKDIIDLYFITRDISLERLFELADRKRVPVAYERLLTINAQGISGKVLSLLDLDSEEINLFIDRLKRATEAEIKKKEVLAMEGIPKLVYKLLWDFPPEDRIPSPYSRPVLKRRLNKLPLPERQALAKMLTISAPD